MKIYINHQILDGIMHGQISAILTEECPSLSEKVLELNSGDAKIRVSYHIKKIKIVRLEDLTKEQVHKIGAMYKFTCVVQNGFLALENKLYYYIELGERFVPLRSKYIHCEIPDHDLKPRYTDSLSEDLQHALQASVETIYL